MTSPRLVLPPLRRRLQHLFDDAADRPIAAERADEDGGNLGLAHADHEARLARDEQLDRLVEMLRPRERGGRFEQHDGVVAALLMRLDPVHGVQHHVIGGGGVGRKLGGPLEQHLGAVAHRLGP